MARGIGRKPGVYGPYRHYDRFRIQLVNERGETTYQSYATEEEAKQVKRSSLRELKIAVGKTVGEAIDLYEKFLNDVKQNKPQSVATTLHRLHAFFADSDLSIAELSEKRCASYYSDLAARAGEKSKKRFAVDTHRNSLAEARTFLKWCAAKDQRLIARNPLVEVDGIGKRKHGKPQLRIDEARKWLVKALQLADEGEDGAVAAMTTLLMGMRCSEVVDRVARDLDDQGRLLWIPETKTEAGRRKLEIPELLQPYLQELAKDKLPEAPLFGHHLRDWPREWVQRICKKAGVPRVSAHGMRGLHSSLALAAGTSDHVVAASLGHESIKTTIESYADAAAVSAGKQRATLKILAGGK